MKREYSKTPNGALERWSANVFLRDARFFSLGRKNKSHLRGGKWLL